MNKYLLYILMFLGVCPMLNLQVVYAQNPCYESLYNAKKLYESGNITQCVELINSCISKVHDNDVIADAYRILAMAYIELHQQKEAEEAVEKLLKYRPNYQTFSQIDALPLKKIIDQYTVRPNWLIGFGAGVNFADVYVNESYSAYKTDQLYYAAPSYQIQLHTEYFYRKKLSVGISIGLSGAVVDHHIKNIRSTLWPTNVGSIRYQEQYRFAQSDVFIRKYLSMGSSLRFYGDLAFGYAQLLASNLSLEIHQSEMGYEQLYTENSKMKRRQNFGQFQGKIGLEKGLSRGFIFLELGYSRFMQNMMDDADRYSSLEFNLENHYVNDDISLGRFGTQIGFKLPISNKIQKVL